MSLSRVRAQRWTWVAVGALAALLLTAGCGRSDSSSGEAEKAVEEAAAGKSPAELVPEEIRSEGVLKVATSVGYPPMEMYEEGTSKIVGVDPELAKMIAGELDLRLDLVNASFPGLIPGLQSGQWHLAMSSMSDTAERRRAVDFVDYFTAGGSIMVAKGNPEGINDISDLCGQDIVGAKGSSNLAILQEYNDSECSEKMRISESEDAPSGLLQLDTERAVATMVDYPVAAMLAEESGKYEVLPKQYDAGPWGVAVGKDNPELTAAVQAAIEELIKDGRYADLLAKYGVSESGVETATVNAGG